MKKLRSIDVIVRMKDVIRILDRALDGDSVYFVTIRTFVNAWPPDENCVRELRLAASGKAAKIRFHYAEYMPVPQYVPNAALDANWLIASAGRREPGPVSEDLAMYGSFEEAKLCEIVKGAKCLFEMPARAVDKFMTCERGLAPQLRCGMTFGQVKAFLKRM